MARPVGKASQTWDVGGSTPKAQRTCTRVPVVGCPCRGDDHSLCHREEDPCARGNGSGCASAWTRGTHPCRRPSDDAPCCRPCASPSYRLLPYLSPSRARARALGCPSSSCGRRRGGHSAACASRRPSCPCGESLGSEPSCGGCVSGVTSTLQGSELTLSAVASPVRGPRRGDAGSAGLNCGGESESCEHSRRQVQRNDLADPTAFWSAEGECLGGGRSVEGGRAVAAVASPKTSSSSSPPVQLSVQQVIPQEA